MPSGRTHDRITIWLLSPVVIISYILTRDGELTLLVAAGFFFSGLMFGPDLDIYSVQFKRWGTFRWLWIPYQKLLHHRSFLSHGFIIGTIIRIIYLSLWLLIFAIFIVAILQLIVGFNWNWHTFIIEQFNLITNKYSKEAISLFIGLEIGAMSHYLSDILSSFSKRKAKNQKTKQKRIKSKIKK